MTREQIGVVAKNLAALSEKSKSVSQRRLAHLCGLALDIGGANIYDLILAEYKNIINNLNLSRIDKIELCRFIFNYINKSPGQITAENLIGFKTSEIGSESIENRVCYLRNYYADRAYTVFAKALSEPKVMYSSDFNGVCEDVYYNRAKYCILPVENSIDGILSGFRTLINKYELNIALTCDIDSSSEEDSFTKFALLRRGIGNPAGLTGSTQIINRRFEFIITFENGSAALCDILDAALTFGLKLEKINSLPASYSERGEAYNISLICPFQFGRLEEFITFLSLEAPQYTAAGLYSHII